MALEPIPITFCSGMNNRDTALNLFVNKSGQVPSVVNADTTYLGKLKLLRPLAALNKTAESSSIHSVFRGQDLVLAGTATYLKYRNGGTLTTLLSSLTSGAAMSFALIGNWIFIANGNEKRAVYITTPVGTGWGQAKPTAAPTTATGAAGDPDGTYSCYYRYRITLPDGTIIRTELSSADTVAPSSERIEWSAIVHASFTGATTNQVELFRTKSSFSATYLVATLDSGTTTYSDNVDDATLITQTEFNETGYYPPPDNVDAVIYHTGCNRLFAVVDNSIYWSEAGLYHTFLYSAVSGAYSSTNSVFLSGENVTGLAIFDEQLYISSQRTWKRLRGLSPSSWEWENTQAIKGSLCLKVVASTPWGIIYVGNDSRIWLFDGYHSEVIVDDFVFDTTPDIISHATFDGRYYKLCYNDSTYPELILDFLGFPNRGIRVIQSTRTADCSHYDQSSNEYYVGSSDGYLKNGDDESTDVTLTMRTPEIPIDMIVNLGDAGSLLVHANTQGDNLIITPYQDEEAQDNLTAFVSTSLIREALPLPLNIYRTMSFGISITTSEDITIQEPWLLRKEDDG